jgi:hypothetical protein
MLQRIADGKLFIDSKATLKSSMIAGPKKAFTPLPSRGGHAEALCRRISIPRVPVRVAK